MNDDAAKHNYAVVAELLDEYAIAYYDSIKAWDEANVREAIRMMRQAALKIVYFITDLSVAAQTDVRSYAHDAAHSAAKEGVN